MTIGRSGRSVLFRATTLLAAAALVLVVGGALYSAMSEADPMAPPAPEALADPITPRGLLEDIDVLVRTIEEVHVDPVRTDPVLLQPDRFRLQVRGEIDLAPLGADLGV